MVIAALRHFIVCTWHLCHMKAGTSPEADPLPSVGGFSVTHHPGENVASAVNVEAEIALLWDGNKYLDTVPVKLIITL